MTDFNYEDRIKELELFNKWADFEGLDTKMSSETEHSSKETHLAFLAWIAVKAQAVPDTHIVVPKQPTPKMIDATWDFDDEIIEMSSNTRNEFIWKKMVEASESGAEG